jgi:UDP-N-acetylmuramoyl-tripeptide--D-alanyl-D-alanine ligase
MNVEAEMHSLDMAVFILFALTVSYYLITNLQWYNYKIERVLFYHTKPWWNVTYFILPLLLYWCAQYFVSIALYASIAILFVYIIMLYLWYKTLDKPLVFTPRIQRFFGILFSILILFALFDFKTILLSLTLSLLFSIALEKILFLGYKKRARAKLQSMDGLIVIGVTASYGKTSIKNMIDHIIGHKYRAYATPRSVNTLGGVIRDINEDLPSDTQVYIVEMGARGKGDIAEITLFVEPQFVVVGKIGPAHIDYFKTLENIRDTKMEIIKTPKLKKAFVHTSAHISEKEKIEIFGDDISEIHATLEGISFELNSKIYSAHILGAFNALNIAAAIKIAQALNISEDEITKRVATLQPTPHRLQKIESGGKIIIDDSFNGNIDGMLSSFELAATYGGRKVIITPGLVEVDDALNIQVAQKANEIFDLVIITGELNYAIFKEHIDSKKLLKLDLKSQMQAMLARETKAGDLILFANDAPSFV